jgi:N-acetylated-alpha-linked acidic dipeptidase
VYDEWHRAAQLTDTTTPAMTDPGGGSDFAGFYNHLGIPILDWGFGGPSGVYHSQYDDFAWMSKFGDPTFEFHAAAARIGAAMVLRLANADVLPYDYIEFARTMQRYLPALDRALATRGWPAGTHELRGAIQRMEREAMSFAAARDAAMSGAVPHTRLVATNAALRDVERALTRPTGLRSRPWYRNLVYVADEDNGYATMVFPSVNEAIRARDARLTASEMTDLAQRFDAAARALSAARDALGP